MTIKPRHLTHGFIDALINAKRERRPYDVEEAKRIAYAVAMAEANQDRALQ